jgi:hypothetical protein
MPGDWFGAVGRPGDSAKTPHAIPKTSLDLRLPVLNVHQPCALNLYALSSETFEILSIAIPPDLGLRWNADLGLLEGIPLIAGEFPLQVDLFWQSKGQKLRLQQSLEVWINPDPRAMWLQELEPGPQELYPKPHLQLEQLQSPAGRRLIGGSRRGRAHAVRGGFREDHMSLAWISQATGSDKGSAENFDVALLAVADGAGSAQFSREASRILCETWTQAFKNIWSQSLKVHSQSEMIQSPFLRTIMGGALLEAQNALRSAVEQSCEAEGRDFDQASRDWASTFLTLCVVSIPGDAHRTGRTRVVPFMMGDGAILAWNGQDCQLMGAPEHGDFAGETRFFLPHSCPPESWDSRMMDQDFENLQALFVMSDGVFDPLFGSEANALDREAFDFFWKAEGSWGKSQGVECTQGMEAIVGSPLAAEELGSWLGFWSKGEHDDRTLALWYSAREEEC